MFFFSDDDYKSFVILQDILKNLRYKDTIDSHLSFHSHIQTVKSTTLELPITRISLKFSNLFHYEAQNQFSPSASPDLVDLPRVLYYKIYKQSLTGVNKKKMIFP